MGEQGKTRYLQTVPGIWVSFAPDIAQKYFPDARGKSHSNSKLIITIRKFQLRLNVVGKTDIMTKKYRLEKIKIIKRKTEDM